jgi:transcriptional regulator with XRE-family HTH domain
MKMLPEASSKDFPAALKRERTAKNMSRAQLAKAAGIHAVMPRRYEEANCTEFAKPNHNTWLALNKALGLFESPDVHELPSLDKASLEEITAELKKRGISVTLSFSTEKN